MGWVARGVRSLREGGRAGISYPQLGWVIHRFARRAASVGPGQYDPGMTTARHAPALHPEATPDPASTAVGAGAQRPRVLPAASPDELAGLLPDGNVCVLGAPGSGKTALLEAVLLRLHGANGDGPGVLIVPSRQAASASTDRLLAGMRGDAAGGLGAITWQQLARQLVTTYADLLGYRGEPRILSGAEQWALVRALLTEGDADGWGPMAPLVPTRGFADELADFVLACERRLLGAEELLARAATEGVESWRYAAAFLARYADRLARDDALDHAGLVMRAGDLLEASTEILAATSARVGTLLVDEAQELDPAQLRLVRLLAAGGVRVVLAGDPAGAVEAYRGAVPGALPDHAQAIGATTVLLPGSRRLGPHGLEAVRRLRELDRSTGGQARLLAGSEPSASWREQDRTGAADGAALAVVHAGSRTEEAEVVAALLRRAHQRDGVPYRRMAVLLTHRSQAGPVRHALERFDVPYRAGAGDGSMLDEPVVARALDLFRLALEPNRADELLPGLLTSVLGGLDPHELRSLRRAAVIADQPLSALIEGPMFNPPEPGVDPPATPSSVPARPTARDATATAAAADPSEGTTEPGDATGGTKRLEVVSSRTRRRVAVLQALRRRAEAWVRLEADRCFWELWRAAPGFRRLVHQVEVDPGDAAAGRQLDALTGLSRALTTFVDVRPGATIGAWLDLADRAQPSAEPWPLAGAGVTDAVSVLGLGAAKGLDVDVAVVMGCLEGTLPRSTWPDGPLATWRLDAGPAPLERARAWIDAERRRFVLAASRASKRTVFTWSLADGHGEPSRFLAELGLPVRPELAAPAEAAAGSDLGSRPDALGFDGDPVPCTLDQVAGTLRRALAGQERPRAERLAAATSLARMPGVEPPAWWWERDWTVDPEPIAPERRLRTSYTRISVYEECHLRYFYASVAGLDDRATYRMVFGKLMHTIFELAATGAIGGDPDALKAAFRERFDPTWFPSRAVAAQYWRDGLTMLRYWYEGEAELARAALAIEVGFDIDVGGHAVRGRIDRVDRAEDGEGIILLDYKTARSIPSEAEAARSLQLAIYYLAALRDPELAAFGPPVEMQLVYPAEQRGRRFRRVAQRPDDDHAERVERRLLPLLEGAAAERFEPDPHADCRFCAFKTICPLWPQGEEFLAPAAEGADAAAATTAATQERG
jgi:superfamily I DNA/RNA helicase/RecB family exonuclease